MTLAALALLLSGCASGRLYTSPTLHVGLRPAVVRENGGELGVGFTLQISTTAGP